MPVAEVADAAGISKPTLLRYLPAEEDLVLHRIAHHEEEAARVVTGLNDDPGVLAFHTPLVLTRAVSRPDVVRARPLPFWSRGRSPGSGRSWPRRGSRADPGR